MSQDTKGNIISVLPSLLWVALAAAALATFHQSLSELLARSTKLKVGILEVEAQALIEKSAKQLPQELTHDLSSSQALRLRTQWVGLSERTRPYRILIAHDVFLEAKPIQRAFLDLGFDADIALCPDDIERMLRQHAYDAVVSDINWSECKNLPSTKQNGVDFLSYAVQQRFDQPTIFFVANYDPKLGVPRHSYGISDNWYDILENVFAIIKASTKTVP